MERDRILKPEETMGVPPAGSGAGAVLAHRSFLERSRLVHTEGWKAMNGEAGMERVSEWRNRGRAATANPSGRFEPISRHVFDDGWQTLDELPPFKTEVYEERPRTVITRNTSPDISLVKLRANSWSLLRTSGNATESGRPPVGTWNAAPWPSPIV